MTKFYTYGSFSWKLFSNNSYVGRKVYGMFICIVSMGVMNLYRLWWSFIFENSFLLVKKVLSLVWVESGSLIFEKSLLSWGVCFLAMLCGFSWWCMFVPYYRKKKHDHLEFLKLRSTLLKCHEHLFTVEFFSVHLPESRKFSLWTWVALEGA